MGLDTKDYVYLKKEAQNKVTESFDGEKGTIVGRLGRLYVVKFEHGIIYEPERNLENVNKG